MIHKLFLAIILFSVSLLASGQKYQVPSSNRVEKNINSQWTFNYFSSTKADKGGYENPDFNDSQWSYISVPHTWQTYETTHELHPYIRNVASKDDSYWWDGWGWYRKHLIIDKVYKDQRIYFEFDGVQKYSKIYLNGQFLADHKGGFTSFYVDATQAVRFGEDNVLVVAVNNSLNDKYNIPPMNAGNWSVYGGITRDVRVVIKDPVHVPYQGSYKHEGGTFITTPKADAKEAKINIKTYVENNFAESRKVKIVTVLADANRQVFDRIESTETIQPGEIKEFVQDAKTVKKPNLWSPETPYIYNAYTEVYDGNRLADVFHSTFGIRSIDWDYTARRLILNGKRIQLHGINRHEEYVWLGSAFPKWIANRDMEDIANGLEVNFMRTAHYPNDPTVYSFMDEHGICIDEELPNIKNQEFDPKVQEQNCREMIRRDRNHPSIVLWSMGNETDHACDSRYAHEEDNTRIITVRQPYNESYNPEFCKHTDKQMPIESFLRCTVRGWYDKDDKDLEPADSQWAGTEEWQHKKSNEQVISDHNGSVWLYADHGADREYVGCPLKHVNPKGWVDSWRTPKYVYYQWQANFAKTPMVFIHPHFWRSQYLGQKKDFIIDSNCEKVELFVNGKSKGIQKPAKSNNYNVTFKGIPVEEGKIEAIGTSKDGKTVKNEVIMAGAPAALTLSTTAKTMMCTPENIIEFKVDIVDKNGVHVYGANNTLKFTVEGPAKLIGPDLYISDRDKHEEYEGTMYIDAPVTNLIRAIGKTGKVTITVSATGLKPASATIEVLPWQDAHAVKGITEPPLNPDGRKPVEINKNQANFIQAPVEMKNYAGELRFDISQKTDFSALAKKFVTNENPELDTQTPEFKYVIEAFTAILNSTANFSSKYGYIVADDYNFIARQYNVSRAITKNLQTKNLPEAYKQAMTEYYAQTIVSKGKDVNFMAINKMIDKIPTGGQVVWIGKADSHKDMICSEETDLKIVLQKVCPESNEFSKDNMKKALTLIDRLNPCITYKSIQNKKTKEKTDKYTIQSENIILIPEAKSLLNNKFPDRKF